MEDFILREIDKIGLLLRGLLAKVGLGKSTGAEQTVAETAKVELGEGLNLDIDTLLANERFIEHLIAEHNFSPENLEQFAELLADLAAAASSRDEQCRMAAAACEIYKYQDAHKAPVSLNRYYILRELSKYNS